MSTYLGQNFLKDSSVRAYIANAVEKMYESTQAQVLMEIGPGKWAITKRVKDISPNFFVVEKDLRMEEHLLEIGLKKEQIVFWDILEADIAAKIGGFQSDFSSTLAIGNLPYYITSPIFRLLFGTGKPEFLWGIFMIQDEVGEKIMTPAVKKSYLWRLLNRGYEVRYLKMVPPKCFSPPPKVKSCLVQFIRKEKPVEIDFQLLVDFLNVFAPYSRKTLGRIDKLAQKQGNQLRKISEELRGKRLEELSREDIKTILTP